MLATPKRKRGQHRARHPWSNAVKKRDLPEPFNDDDCRRWNCYSKFRSSEQGRLAATNKRDQSVYAYFMAGYRAGKGAK